MNLKRHLKNSDDDKNNQPKHYQHKHTCKYIKGVARPEGAGDTLEAHINKRRRKPYALSSPTHKYIQSDDEKQTQRH